VDEGQTTTSSNSPQQPTGQNGRNDVTDLATSDTSQERSSPEGSGNDVPDDDVDSGTSADSSFADFARTRFQLKGTTSTYCCAALPGPLLHKSDKGDYLVRHTIYTHCTNASVIKTAPLCTQIFDSFNNHDP
jgi:hypothetical protein